MKKFILFAHSGSKNHGCEALIRSTCDLLKVPKEHITLISAHPEEDMQYGLDTQCRILKSGTTAPIKKKSLKFLNAYFHLKLFKNYTLMDHYGALAATDANPNDIALSVGGDTYCYASDITDLVNDHTLWKRGRLKTVYWGCSIEPTLLKDITIANDIRRFNLITARESISYEALKKVNPNTVLTVDSAFFLKPQPIELPKNFRCGNTVGINISPLTMNCGKTTNIVFENFKSLIQYLLNNTDLNICLIPHVIKPHDNDLVPLTSLYSAFEHTNRVCMVEDHSAEQLKWIISQCRFFVGARTHATIAAYSTFVPTLVVGYSVKSRGIAKDLFGTEHQYVLAAQDMHNSNDLLDYFLVLMQQEHQIRQHLIDFMPSYLQRINNAIQALECL